MELIPIRGLLCAEQPYEGLICFLVGVQMVIFANVIVPSLNTTIVWQVKIGFPNQKEISSTQPPLFTCKLLL